MKVKIFLALFFKLLSEHIFLHTHSKKLFLQPYFYYNISQSYCSHQWKLHTRIFLLLSIMNHDALLNLTNTNNYTKE